MVLAAAKNIPELRAVITIGAPAEAEHVLKNLGSSLDKIREEGESEVKLAGRKFRIGKQFVEDVSAQRVREAVAEMRKTLLILTAPLDQTVGTRSEEHTSELPSLMRISYAVFCLKTITIKNC